MWKNKTTRGLIRPTYDSWRNLPNSQTLRHNRWIVSSRWWESEKWKSGVEDYKRYLINKTNSNRRLRSRMVDLVIPFLFLLSTCTPRSTWEILIYIYYKMGPFVPVSRNNRNVTLDTDEGLLNLSKNGITDMIVIIHESFMGEKRKNF